MKTFPNYTFLPSTDGRSVVSRFKSVELDENFFHFFSPGGAEA